MQATTVAAQGDAETEYDLVAFNVSLTTLGKSVLLAKSKLKTQVDELLAVIEDMKSSLGVKIVENSFRSNAQVNEKHDWEKNAQVFKGYEATYSLSFQLDDLTLISQVYDLLTSLKEARIPQPQLLLKNREAVNEAALKNAFKKVKDRFKTECTVLGLNASDFEITSWEVSYSDSQRSDRVSSTARSVRSSKASKSSVPMAAMLSMDVGSAAPESDLIEIVAGLAKITVNLEVGYARRSDDFDANPAQRVRRELI